MRQRVLMVVAVVVVVALVAVACGGGDTIVNPGSSAVTGISVSGTGRATAEPDLVLLQLGIEVERSTVAAAREDAAASQQAILDALQANGVDEDDIQTVQLSVGTRYDYSSDNERVLRGYNVSHVVSITLRGVEGASAVIDAAIAAGGNNVIVRDIAFAIEDPTELREAARRDAVEDARERASQLAEAAGIKLGRPISIVESGFTPFQQRGVDEAAFDQADTATPIQAGELEILVRVNILYAIE